MIDNQDYDLVIEENGVLKKVQVKTTGTKAKSGYYEVQLKSVRPNRTGNSIKRFDPSSNDYLFVLVEDGSKYIFPCVEMTTGCSVTLNQSKDRYKV